MEFEPVIGLEVHIELKTKSKMFCGCPAEYFGKSPNTQTCPVCLGLPGALPIPNKKAVDFTVLIAAALGCSINTNSKFDRKNYFYPDLPKGYQISQYDEPIGNNGFLDFSDRDGKETRIRIRRVHLEEDTGKLIHEKIEGKEATLVDFNRCGVPLVEVVTEPDLRSSDEAKIFLKEVQKIIRYLEVSDADMEKGTMRLEPSLSLRPAGSSRLPSYRVELKNINSFRFVQKALDHEIGRQKEILEKGGSVPQETRGWSEAKGVTLYQRSKEEAQEYRYFPEPDIPPLYFSEEYKQSIISEIPELPLKKSQRFSTQFSIRKYDADIICETKEGADFFEKLVGLSHRAFDPQKIANILVNKKVSTEGKTPEQLINEIENLLPGESQIPPELILESVRQVIKDNQNVVETFKSGRVKALDFLIGQTFRYLQGKGKIDPNLIREKLLEVINNG